MVQLSKLSLREAVVWGGRRSGQTLRGRISTPAAWRDRPLVILIALAAVIGLFTWTGTSLGPAAALALGLLGSYGLHLLANIIEMARAPRVYRVKQGKASAAWLVEVDRAGNWHGRRVTSTRHSGLGLWLIDEARHSASSGTTVTFAAANEVLERLYMQKLGFTATGSPRGLTWTRP